MAEFGIGSDYKTIVTFLADGVAINATGTGAPVEFTLDYYTSNQTLKKTASKIAGVYTNCVPEVVSGVVKIVVAFDDVAWEAGDVICKATITYNDTHFPDLKRTSVAYIETGDIYDRL